MSRSNFTLTEGLRATTQTSQILPKDVQILSCVENIVTSWGHARPGFGLEVSIIKLAVDVVAALEKLRPTHRPDNWPKWLAVEEREERQEQRFQWEANLCGRGSTGKGRGSCGLASTVLGSNSGSAAKLPTSGAAISAASSAPCSGTFFFLL